MIILKYSFTPKGNFPNPHYPFTLQLVSLGLQKDIFNSICCQCPKKLEQSGIIFILLGLNYHINGKWNQTIGFSLLSSFSQILRKS